MLKAARIIKLSMIVTMFTLTQQYQSHTAICIAINFILFYWDGKNRVWHNYLKLRL